MRDIEVPPEPQLMESMRAVGYTLQTAIADIVDNSISANAAKVEIFFLTALWPIIWQSLMTVTV